jgi:hypothetical protein
LLAYAFLTKGAIEPLSGFVWPTPTAGEPGVWVDRDAAPSEALRGCVARNLPYWLDDELWRIELAGTVTERGHLLLAERARLVGRVPAWGEPLAWEFVIACARRVARQAAAALHEAGQADAAARLERAGDLPELDMAASSVADYRGPAARLSGYLTDVCFYARDASAAPHAAGVAAKMSAYAIAGDPGDARGHDERLAEERAWQAGWLVDRIGL